LKKHFNPLIAANKMISKKININYFKNKLYSHKMMNKVKKCHHIHSMHYQPSELYMAYSRYGLQPTIIAFMTNFNNIRARYYTDRDVIRYYSILRIFSNFIFYFFRRNLLTNILSNLNYSSNYIFSNYFMIFRLFSKSNFRKNLLPKVFSVKYRKM